MDQSLSIHEPLTARLAIRLTPRAAADRIDGWDVDPDGRPVLKVRVRAQPVEGEANAALTVFLAKTLGVPKRAVTLARGGQSRLKMIEVEGLSDVEVRDRLSGA
ncbi:DUF167 domain-containing protein [Brevundimonas pondensis]|uniref:UPF0235 protein IFE19_00765 n=1 Tax=Brevundimonas pondensis TaxID=2774189 RepID=A0ABX7SMF7_9CAUL|nr:DUF167 domain-containing protein [Brevundimonas pondensis]